jgi:hypothetical protein
VTVCIGAFAENEARIVVVADSKVAFGDFSADTGALKYQLLGQGYLSLIAGNDVVYAAPTINRVQKEIFRTKTRDADEIAEIVHEQLCQTRNRIIESKVLKKYNLSLEEFVSKGKKSFTEQAYYDIYNRIERERLSLEFLVAGFDAHDKPHLRIVTAEEPPHDYDSLGFASVGSGAAAALASLTFAKDHCAFARHCDIEEATYFLLSAKFMAESATDVGRETFFLSISPTRGIYHLYDMGAVDEVRRLWLKEGAQRRSKRTIKALKDLLYSHVEGFFNSAVMGRSMKYVRPSFRKGMKALIEVAKERETGKKLAKPSDSQTLEGQR